MSNVLAFDRQECRHRRPAFASASVSAARRCARAAALALFALGADSARAEGSRLASGTLACKAAATQSFVIGAVHSLTCVYTPQQGAPEPYIGEVRRIGLDIGFGQSTDMIWAVLVGTDGKPDSLAGTYVGVSAGAAPGIGFGANALIGGSARTISLQPLSLELRTGLNLNVAGTSLTLRRP